MAQTALGIRQQMAAAARQIQRVKRSDRIARALISLGGVGVVASVLGILLFIAAEAAPLFLPAQGRLTGAALLEGTAPPAAPPLALGVDEYQRYVYVVRPDARIAFHRVAGGALAREVALPGLGDARVSAVSRSGDFVAAGSADGKVSLVQVRFRPRYEEQRLADLEIEVRERGLVALDPRGRAVREVSYAEAAGQKAVAALIDDAEIVLWRADENGAEQRATLTLPAGEKVTRLALGRVESLVAGTGRGNVYHWELAPEVRLTDVARVSDGPVTALEWMAGGVSFVAGDAAGRLTSWFRVRLREDDEERALVRAHSFAPHRAEVVAIAASSRDKSFVSVAADGALALHFLTSERKLLELHAAGRPRSVVLTPKNDGILVAQADGALARFAIHSPHPEVTAKALFGKVWYEGYSKPEYVWQSTGGTDDFEAKLSLVPLAFGTIKGTFYALLFAIPLAVLAALYTSQFVHPQIRAKVKPTVEVMAALPSVVIGFIAGLWLSGLVERHVVAVLMMVGVVPASAVTGYLLWSRLPASFTRGRRAGGEAFVIAPLLVAGGWLCLRLAPLVERLLFQGDFRSWLQASLGLTYDPRNSLVVGLAMGFAVIPIIFTISEDAFSSVPSSLTAGSLALGASRWQTALQVVLPTASPGIFSAVMIGFGRAVGETMIVLMATGNTPVLDWSIFNGMRTLSANIAVEIPEAPHGGTLYRVLFLAGGLLFAMTFLVNTAAELIRQRLRERYKAL